MTDIELEETLTHIQQLRIDSEHKLEDIRRIVAEHDRRRQVWWQPWVVLISGLTAGGALLAAGAALATLALHALGRI